MAALALSAVLLASWDSLVLWVRLSGVKEVHVQDVLLGEHTLVSRPAVLHAVKETRRFIDSVFKRHGIEAPRVQIETNSVTFLPNLIAATGLLSFISRRNLGRGNVAAPLREVRVKGTSLLRQFALVHRKDAYLSPAAVRFMELLRERGQSLFAKAFESGRSGK